MSSLANRSLILSFARLGNYAVLMLSPILLVRILSVEDYGSYRQFVVYALFIVSIVTYSIPGNLTYFIAREPKNAKEFVSNSVLLMLATTLLGIAVVFLGRPGPLESTTTEYVLLLGAYVFFFVNLDIVEVYWIATRRPGYILIYTAIRVSVRLATVVIAAYLASNITSIFRAMVALEAFKFFCLFIWWRRQNLLTACFAPLQLKEQIHFIVPFGAGSALYNANEQIGRLLVASMLGPTALAMYSIASYNIPVLTVIKSSLADVVFPEMVERTKHREHAGLQLWKRTNVIYCFAIFPLFFVLMTYAHVFVQTLFTFEYLPAVAAFQLLLLILIRKSFDFGLLIRSRNRNVHFVVGNFIGLFANLIVSLILIEKLGFLGPAIGLVVGSFLVMLYLAVVVLRIFCLSIGELLMWKQVGKLMGLAVVCTPLLLLAEELIPQPLLAASSGAVVYLSTYLFLCTKAAIPEVAYVLRRLPGEKLGEQC